MTRRQWRKSLRASPLYDPVAAALGKARDAAAELRPAFRQRTDGRTSRRAYVCPAKMFARHPDAEVRRIAFEQAREAHALNDIMAHGHECAGPCRAKACRPEGRFSLSMFVKNDTTMRIAIGQKRAAAWREKTTR